MNLRNKFLINLSFLRFKVNCSMAPLYACYIYQPVKYINRLTGSPFYKKAISKYINYCEIRPIIRHVTTFQEVQQYIWLIGHLNGPKGPEQGASGRQKVSA